VLCSLFALGGLYVRTLASFLWLTTVCSVCIASILRLVSVLTESTDPDVTWNFVNQGVWALVESDFAMIGACLPCLRPVWLRIRPRYFETRSMPSTRTPMYAIGTKDSRDQPSRGLKKHPHPWDASILASWNDAGADDEHHFAQMHDDGATETSYSSLKNVELTSPALAVPLGPLRNGGGIQVTRDWNIDYKRAMGTDQEYAGDGMVTHRTKCGRGHAYFL
jgi:hypothetical protein